MDPSKMIGERTDVTLEIRYCYDDKDDFGLLYDRVPIFIDRSSKEEDELYKEVDIRSRKLSFRLNHPNFLGCLGYDRLDNVDGSTSGNAIYHKYSEELIEFIDRCNPQIIQQFKVPALNCVDNKKLTYNCISDVYKQFFRDMIDFIIYLHNEMNLSLIELELDRNLVVADSMVKFFRLRFNESTTTQSKNEDFKHLAKVIEQVFDRQQIVNKNKSKNKRDHMPPDFVHLLDCMSSYHESNDDQLLLKYHLALLRSGERLRMIKDFRGKECYLSSKQRESYDKVFDTMGKTESGAKIWEDWTVKLDGRHPEYGLIKDCFDSSETGSRIDGYTSLNRNLISFCYNMTEHINSIDIAQYNQHEAFTEQEVECILMAAYGEQLVAFQKEAKKHGVLEFLI